MTPFHTMPNGDHQMNYEPNTVHWRPGDLVLHDSDAKERHMLMRVVNYATDGRCRTEYLFDSPDRRRMWRRGKRSTLLNPTVVLHDPARFGIDAKTISPDEIP